MLINIIYSLLVALWVFLGLIGPKLAKYRSLEGDVGELWRKVSSAGDHIFSPWSDITGITLHPCIYSVEYLRYGCAFFNTQLGNVIHCVMWKSKPWVDFTLFNGSGNSALFMAIYGCVNLLFGPVGGVVFFNISTWAFYLLMGRICRVMCENITAIESVSSVLLTLYVINIGKISLLGGRRGWAFREGIFGGWAADSRPGLPAAGSVEQNLWDIAVIFLTHN